MSVPKFFTPSVSFHAELKKRIHDYFTETGRPQTGNYKLFIKASILVVSFIAIYIHLIFFTPSTFVAILECIMLGGLTASIGFNVMHDGAHGSFSRYKWLNEFAGLSLNLLGANVFMWKTKHNVIHHAFTNIDGIDDDLDAKPFLRLCETQKFHKLHSYQHFYFWFVYAFLYIYWIFVSDYIKYFTKKVGTMPLKKMKLGDHFSFWGFKALYAVLFVALPIFALGFMPWLIGFLTFSMFAGFVLSIIFQLAHTVEDTDFPVADIISNRMEDEWAIHQLRTTANFATRNKVLSWFAGGLNYQIEHHLFPKISHIHYPEISKIIKQACHDFGVKYIEYTRVSEAVVSHVLHLKELGRVNTAN